LGIASLQFLGYALVVVLVFNLGRSGAWRQFVLLAGSIVFLGFFSRQAAAFAPLAAFLLFGFISLRLMQGGATRLFVPLVIIAIGAFMWLKQYAFIPPSLFLRASYVTLGLSYILFRVLHLIIDSRSQYSTLPRKISAVSYLNYTLNFTTLVSGPIQRYSAFASMQLAPDPLPINFIIGGQALERIIVGFFKVNVVSLSLRLIHSSALISLATPLPERQRILTTITVVVVYPFYLYCNFSGYIDIVIGIARFLRLVLPENFNRPFFSENYMIFWSRWHITLSTWLSIYVYTPLLLKSVRRWPSPTAEPFLECLALFVTFFLVGLWHGQTASFVFFGVLQGLGVSMAKLYQVLMTKWLGPGRYKSLANGDFYNVAARGLTFTFCAFALLWFWSNWTQIRSLAGILGARDVAIVWIAVFAGSALALAVWEGVRLRLLAIRFEDRPLFSSRYVRTVWTTALAVIAAAAVLLLNAPAPDIVYRTF
jgi:alginate O-acetyltransferase complex protein AlgI